MSEIREPAVAGTFYSADAEVLRGDVSRLLREASSLERLRQGDRGPKAIIAPHAGYSFSGSCAARAHLRFMPDREQITRIVLLGPSHRVPFHGLATTEASRWRTPLGEIPIDQAAIDDLSDLPQVTVMEEAHVLEHSLEVHLPFLQATLPRFSLVPFSVSSVAPGEVAAVLERLWGGSETRFVISTDLSHFLNDQEARALDAKTARAIEAFAYENLVREQACGRVPTAGLLALAAKRGMTIERVNLCNSSDSMGSKDRVVGYGAWTLSECDDAVLAETHGQILMKLAGESIASRLKRGEDPTVAAGSFPVALRGHRATFITLTLDGKLRGCRGSLRAHQPLAVDVALNACASAFDDPRFPPLTAAEFVDLKWSISLLTPPLPFPVTSREDLLGTLQPGRDGLIVQDKGKQATFLPAVWDSLPDPEVFLARLWQKAGLARNHWSDSLRLWRYQATKIGDEPR